MGESGSPSTWVTCPSREKICCPQPTAQKGQIDFVTRSASSVRTRLSAVPPSDRDDAPRASGSVPVTWRRTGQRPTSLRSPTITVLPGAGLPNRPGRVDRDRDGGQDDHGEHARTDERGRVLGEHG